MKIKSYSFWTSLSAATVIIVKTICEAFGLEFEEKIVGDIIMAICGLLVVFGVVTMPSKKESTEVKEKIEKKESEENIIDDRENK